MNSKKQEGVYSSLHLVHAPSLQSPHKSSEKKNLEFRNLQTNVRGSVVKPEQSIDSLAVLKKSPQDFMKRKTMAGDAKGKIGEPFTIPAKIEKRKTLKDLFINQQPSVQEQDLNHDDLMERIRQKKEAIQKKREREKKVKLSIEAIHGHKKENFISKMKQFQQERNVSESSSSSSNSSNNRKPQTNKNNNKKKRKSIRVKDDQAKNDLFKGLGILDKSLNDNDAGVQKILNVKQFFNQANHYSQKQVSDVNVDLHSPISQDQSGKNQLTDQNMRFGNKVSESYMIQVKQSETQIPLINENIIPSLQMKMINNLQLPSEDVTIIDNNAVSGTGAPTANISKRSGDEDNNSNNHSKVNFSLLLDDQIIKRNIPPFIINPTAFWKTTWNVAMLFLILFLALTVPYRIPFEDSTTHGWLVTDITIDFLFQVDLLMNFFTAYEDDNGELIVDRCKIANSYIKSWFLVDILSSIPISLILWLTGTDGSNVLNIKFIKLSRLPRLYRLLRLLKLMRLYKQNKLIEKVMVQINMSVQTNKLIKSLVMIAILLHFIGCLWATVATLTIGDQPMNWMTAIGVDNENNIDKYVASVYWAAVTIYTVGYGDIIPQNVYEFLANVILLFIGVSLYTYIFAQLSTLFSNVQSNDTNSQSRDKIITELALRHRFSDDLTKKIQFFFSQQSNASLISLSKEYEIDELIKILPAHLKSEISYFLYSDAIKTIKVLQDKDQRFYGDYLTKFEPMRIKSGTVFAKEGTSPQEVFFLLKGCVEFERQGKFYTEGSIFGESDIILKRNRLESYIAKCDCYILKLERSIFEQIYEEFADIREEINQIVAEREKKRIENFQHKQHGNQDLQRIVSLINFEELKKAKQSEMNFNEFLVKKKTLGPDGNSGDVPSTFANKFIHQSHTVISPDHNQNLLKVNAAGQSPQNNGNTPQHTFGGHRDDGESVSEGSNDDFMKDHKHTDQYTPLLPIKSESPEFNYNKIPIGGKGSMGPANKLSLHLTKIENIKNSMIMSFSKDQNINKNKVEERLQETKNQIQLEHQINKLKDIYEDEKNEIDENLEYGYESGGTQTRQVDFATQLRNSLQRLKTQVDQEGRVIRQPTQKDHLVTAGNPGANQEEEFKEEDGNHTNRSPDQTTILDNSSHIPRLQDSFHQIQEEIQQTYQTYGDNQNQNINTDQETRAPKGPALKEPVEPLESGSVVTAPIESSGPKNRSFASGNTLPNFNLNLSYNPLEVGYQDYDVKQLSENIQNCLSSIINTKLLIKEYSSLFMATVEQMGDDANEIIKKHYEQGKNCLESYMNIMIMIEKMIKGIDLQTIDSKISKLRVNSDENEKRLYFFENRVKMVQEILQRKIKELERQRQRMLQQKPLVIVKRNPLLDTRDEKHAKQNEKLAGKEPSNL